MHLARHALAVFVTVSAIQVQAADLLTNGGFETGDFTGWTANTKTGSNGDLSVQSLMTGPHSGLSNAGPSAGQFFALSDQTNPGTYALTQAFTVASGTTSVIFKFDLFANNYANSTIVDPIGLDHTGPANQHVRVDLLTGTADAFDTGAGVLGNFYLGADAGSNPNPWTSYSFDLTSLAGAGGTYQIRFAEVDNQNFFNMGVDNVSINVAAVPEPGTYALMLAGLAGVGFVARARRR